MNKVYSKFTRRIADEIMVEAKVLAPIKTGNLKSDIKVWHSKGSLEATIGNTLATKYAKFVHFGTKPHIIKAKKAKVLAKKIGKKGVVFFGKEVNHPGTKAQPYLQNALKNYMNNGGFARAKTDLNKQIREDILKGVKNNFKKA